MSHLFKALLPHGLATLGLSLLMVVVLGLPASAAPFWYVDPVTPYGDQVNSLYQLMMWISIAILIAVEVALVMALIKFRKKPGENREPETWSHNTKLEIIWTVIPFVLLVIIMVPTFKALAYIADVPKNADLTLEIVGHQYYWEYRYPELNATFNSTPRDNKGNLGEPLLIPTNRDMKVVMTAADVIHSWWIPAFGFQQMTTPGNLSQVPMRVTKEGEYTGACAFLCGPQHGAMSIFVKAVPNAEFLTWAAAHKASGAVQTIADVGQIGKLAPPPKANEKEEHAVAPGAHATTEPAKALTPEEGKASAEKGAALYASRCAGCHQATGAGIPGVFPPLEGAEQVNGADEELVTIILKGKSGPLTVKGVQYNGAMPPMGAGLSDEEVAAIANYVRTSWGNNGKFVAPSQVEALR